MDDFGSKLAIQKGDKWASVLQVGLEGTPLLRPPRACGNYVDRKLKANFSTFPMIINTDDTEAERPIICQIV